jgi:hypothetical protein
LIENVLVEVQGFNVHVLVFLLLFVASFRWIMMNHFPQCILTHINPVGVGVQQMKVPNGINAHGGTHRFIGDAAQKNKAFVFVTCPDGE